MNNPSGKTYSLFANFDSTVEYYKTIRDLIEKLLLDCPDEETLLSQIRKTSGRRALFRIFHKKYKNKYFEENILKPSLSKFTKNVKNHLKELSLIKRLDPIIGATEEQYHLYMLEIELVNRIYKKDFKQLQYKMALLPHCLRDYHEKCLSIQGDIEQICKSCNKHCFINLGSKILIKYQIDPYISVTIDQVKLFKNLIKQHNRIGALGIACVPELVRGMRMCLDFGIPAIGIPLDVNRCARWMGRAHETSFSLEELEYLVK